MANSKRTSVNKYRLCYNKWGTAEEYLNKLIDLVEDPLQSMQEMDGDMYLSEYQKLVRAYWLLKNRSD